LSLPETKDDSSEKSSSTVTSGYKFEDNHNKKYKFKLPSIQMTG